MTNEWDEYRDFDLILKEQRHEQPETEKILKTIKVLPVEHLVEYLGFLEHRYGYKSGPDVNKVIFNRLGIHDVEFCESYAQELDSKSLERLEKLVHAKSDRLLDTYLHTPFPEKMLDEFALLRANQINVKYKGKFRNALELIKLGIELNKGKNPDELFATFKIMKARYFETNVPPVDINTFFKLIIPILNRCSLRRGPDGFYELRDRIIEELKRDGLTPEQLSIDMLDRRGKHRSGQLTMDDYQGFELY